MTNKMFTGKFPASKKYQPIFEIYKYLMNSKANNIRDSLSENNIKRRSKIKTNTHNIAVFTSLIDNTTKLYMVILRLLTFFFFVNF